MSSASALQKAKTVLRLFIQKEIMTGKFYYYIKAAKAIQVRFRD